MKIKLSLLMGGNSYERDVSFQSANEMMKHLRKDAYDMRIVHIPDDGTKGWIYELLENPPDVVLSALHGGSGENGSVQGLLECLEIPYVGSKVMSSALCMNKNVSKSIMRSHHIPVPDDIFIKKEQPLHMFEDSISQLGFPLVVKPNLGGASIGITIVERFDQLAEAVDLIRDMDDDILIEKYIPGREVTCGIVEKSGGLQVLTVLDIEPTNPFYDYESKYTKDKSKIAFSTLPQFLQTMIQEIAKKVFTVLHCEDYGRVDFIVCEEQVYVLEIDTLPGMTENSLMPKAVRGNHMTIGDFLHHLILLTLEKSKK